MKPFPVPVKSTWAKAIREIAGEFSLPLPPGQMSEENTPKLIEIVFGCAPIKQHPFNRAQHQRGALPEQGVFVEYDGPDHYRDIFKLKRDEERNALFRSEGLRLIRIPFWLQIQKGVAEFLFKVPISEEQERSIAQRIYGVEEISKVLFSGLYDSRYTPANFLEKGRARFRSEFETVPEIVRSSFRQTIRAYIKRVSDEDLVVPKDLRDLLL